MTADDVAERKAALLEFQRLMLEDRARPTRWHHTGVTMTDADRKYHADRLRAIADALEAFMMPEEAASRLQAMVTDLERA